MFIWQQTLMSPSVFDKFIYKAHTLVMEVMIKDQVSLVATKHNVNTLVMEVLVKA